MWMHLRRSIRLNSVAARLTVHLSSHRHKALKVRRIVASRAGAGRDLSDREGVSADRLFAELDQHHIMGDPDGSTVEVISIHVTQEAGAWVQLEVAGEPKQ